MLKRKRPIGLLLIVFLLIGSVVVIAVLTKDSDVQKKTFHALLIDEKEILSADASDGSNLYIICAYKGGQPSALTAIKFVPAEGYAFNGQVQCWLREEGKVEYLVNGDLYTSSLSQDAKEIIVEDTSDEKKVNIEITLEKGCSKYYLYEHGFI